MLFILLLAAGVIFAVSLVDNNSGEKTLNEYCRLECRKNINSNKFCC